MLFSEFQQAVKDRIERDAYITVEPAVAVVLQEEPDGEDGDESEEKIIGDALNAAGMVIEVLYPDWAEKGQGLIGIDGVIHVLENRTRNRKVETGTRRRARQCVEKLAAFLIGFRPAEWASPIRIVGIEFLGEAQGKSLWELRYASETRFAVRSPAQTVTASTSSAFDPFQQTIKAEFDADDYFTEDPAIAVVLEEEPDGEDGAASVAHAINTALNSSGMAVQIFYPDWRDAGDGRAVIEGAAHLFENRARNKSETGANRRGREAAEKVAALLHGFMPAQWASYIQVTATECAGESKGIRIWEIRYQAFCRFDVLISVLGTHLGEAIGTENGEMLQVHPTDP